MLRKRSVIPFRATFDGEPIFDAIEQLEPGYFSYSVLRAWEMELMLALQKTEAEYSEIDRKERARMVAGMQLPRFREVLEGHRAMQEAKAKARKS